MPHLSFPKNSPTPYVGGTDPSLLRAMGGGTSTLTHTVGPFREIVGHGEGFGTPYTPRRAPDAVTRPAFQSKEVGLRLQRRASECERRRL
jgi:hypothetical protein